MFAAMIRQLFQSFSQPARPYRRSQARKQPGYRPWLEVFEDRLAPATMRFTNFLGGDWGTDANWTNTAVMTDHHVPTATDTAVIDINGLMGDNRVVYSSDNPPVSALTLSGRNSVLDVQGGTLRVTSGTLAISNQFTTIINGGTLIGQTAFTVTGAALTVNSGTVSAPGDNLTVQVGSTLTLHGGSVPFTTTLINSTLDLGDNSTTGAGVINVIQGTSTLIGNVSAGQKVSVQAFTNASARLNVSGGASNAGTIQLYLNANNASSTLVVGGPGAFTNAPNGIIRADYVAGNGSFAISGNLSSRGQIIAGSNAALPIGGGVYEEAGGTFSGNAWLDGIAFLVTAAPASGTVPLRGACTLQGNNPANTFLDVQAFTNASARLNVSGSASNAGTIQLYLNANNASSTLVVGDPGTFTNAPGGVIRTNYVGGNGTFAIIGELINAGTVNINASLTLGSTGDTENHVNTGDISLANGAVLSIRGNSFVNQAGGVIEGNGTLSANITGGGGAPLSNLGTVRVPTGATLGLTGPFRNFSRDDQRLTGGTYEVTGILQFDNASIVTDDANIVLIGSGGSTGGQIRPTGSGSDALANLAFITSNGSLTLRNGRDFATSASPLTSLRNDGVLTIGTGVGSGSTFYVRTYTQGTAAQLNVNAGRMRIQTAFTNFTGGILTGGIYRLTGPDSLNHGTLQFIGADIITNAATIELNGPFAEIIDLTSPTPQDGLRNFAMNGTAGSFTLRNRNLAVGPFTNSGSLTVASNSTLRVNGAFTQTAAGSLTVQLGGTAAGQFSQVSVTGLATLDGTLNVTLVGGFTPAAGNTFQIVPFGSSNGDFATKTGFRVGAGLFLREDFSSGLTLQVFQAQLVLQQQPSNTTAGQAISPAIQVALVDPATGNPIAFDNTDTVTVAIGNNPGGGTLRGTLIMTVSNGVATFSDLSIDKAGSGYTLVANSSGFTAGTSGNFAITPAAPDHLLFTQQPSDTIAGQAIGPVVTVTVVDQFNNVVTGDNTDAVTLAIGTNPGGGTLRGTLTMTVSNGVATFSDLSIDKAGSGYTLVASSAGLTGTTSVGFAITAVAADHLVFLQQPSNTAVGQTISPVMVAVVDQFGNIVTSDNSDTIMLRLNPNSNALHGTMTVTVVNGIAIFNDLFIDQAGDGYTLHATVAGLMDADSAAFSITP
jgi:hypothetical protein